MIIDMYEFSKVSIPKDEATRLVENEDIRDKASISGFLDQFWKSSNLIILKPSN